MVITILTLFPDMFQGPFSHSIVKHAQEKGKVTIRIVDIRDYGIGKHKSVDDTVYGGGIGMVLRVDVVHAAIQAQRLAGKKERIILMSASGHTFTQEKAKSYTEYDHLLLICGHYEGIDDRIHDYIDEELSVGDFVTTGGEIPAMLVTDAVTRLLPGVLKEGVTDAESHSLRHEETTLLEHPQYTRPAVYNESAVPEVLLSGDHRKIAEWRLNEAVKKTQKIRRELRKKTAS